MLKLNLLTGFSNTKSITVEGTLNSDLIQTINDFVSKNGIEAIPVASYRTEDLEKHELETYIPINGGEYWIEGVSSVEEV